MCGHTVPFALHCSRLWVWDESLHDWRSCANEAKTCISCYVTWERFNSWMSSGARSPPSGSYLATNSALLHFKRWIPTKHGSKNKFCVTVASSSLVTYPQWSLALSRPNQHRWASSLLRTYDFTEEVCVL